MMTRMDKVGRMGSNPDPTLDVTLDAAPLNLGSAAVGHGGQATTNQTNSVPAFSEQTSASPHQTVRRR